MSALRATRTFLGLIERNNSRSFYVILRLGTFSGPRLPMDGRTIQKEVEVKLELPPASLRALKKVPLFKTPPRHTSEVSVYFDTDKHKLRKNGLMLRVRRVRNRYVQTIKATNNSGPFERDEWETELAGQEPDLRMAEGTALERLANAKLQRQLKPL